MLLAAGLVLAGAVGLVAAASSLGTSNEERRQLFKNQLAEALRTQGGLTLLGATLGRGAAHRAFWELTLQDPGGQLWSQRIELAVGADPYADATRDLLVAALWQRVTVP